MYKWKIERINYISKSQLKTDDIISMHVNVGDHIYNCYKRKLWFFWVLRRQLRDNEYERLVKVVTDDGHDIRKLYKHVNF